MDFVSVKQEVVEESELSQREEQNGQEGKEQQNAGFYHYHTTPLSAESLCHILQSTLTERTTATT